MQQQRSLMLFFLVAAFILLGTMQLRMYFAPPKPVEDPEVKTTKNSEPKDTPPVTLPTDPARTLKKDLVEIGEPARDSKFHLHVFLDPLGAGVRSLTLNKFEMSDKNGKPLANETFDLIPAYSNLSEPSFLLYHAPAGSNPDDRPVDTLGRRRWELVKKDGKSVTTTETDAGLQQHSVTFQTEIDGIILSKTYTLTEGEYHLGLVVNMKRPKLDPKAKPSEKEAIRFRYQLTGGKGLPVEGKWYTGTFRNAMIGRQDAGGYAYRDLQDLRQISTWMGGNAVFQKDGSYIRYAGVVVQYFASMIVVDENQSDQKFLRSARPTLETAVAKGRIKKDSLGYKDRLVLITDDGRREHTIFLPPNKRGIQAELTEGQLVAVVYRTFSYDESIDAKGPPHVAERVLTGVYAEGTHAMWEDDITVRVNTEPVSLEPGQEKSHSYLLYNGPVKPRLLREQSGIKAVDPSLIDRYSETLKLSTLTDYPSPGWLNDYFFYPIGGTRLVIFCTNLMHWVLGKMHYVIASYGLSIIILTILVRLIMFPFSRKQALMGIKMQALAPELKKLKEKYKDDNTAFAQAQMDLFRQNDVNPLGSCWLMFIQMPILMGLYFALQESIQFRLEGFWPTWISNLAAPDMMFHWGRNIYFISRDADYGSMLYLGPYFNLLPLIAVGLMVLQQKLMTPPPADKEQEMQQKMMRVMMLVFGIFFYKIAAGLCIYIITSTLWGFAERQFLPKSATGVKGDGDKSAGTIMGFLKDKSSSEQTATTSQSIQGAATPATTKKPGKGKRRRDRAGNPSGKTDEESKGMFQRLTDWWNEVLEQARKK